MPTPAPNGRADRGALPIPLRTTLRLPSAPLSNSAAASVPGVAVVPDANPPHLATDLLQKLTAAQNQLRLHMLPRTGLHSFPDRPLPHTADTAFVAPALSRLHRLVPRLPCSSSIPAPCPNPRRLDTNSSDNCAVALPVPAPAAAKGAHARPGARRVVPAYPNPSALSAPGSNAHIGSVPAPIPPAPPQWL